MIYYISRAIKVTTENRIPEEGRTLKNTLGLI